MKRKVRIQMFLREAKTKNKFVAPISSCLINKSGIDTNPV